MKIEVAWELTERAVERAMPPSSRVTRGAALRARPRRRGLRPQAGNGSGVVLARRRARSGLSAPRRCSCIAIRTARERVNAPWSPVADRGHRPSALPPSLLPLAYAFTSRRWSPSKFFSRLARCDRTRSSGGFTYLGFSAIVTSTAGPLTRRFAQGAFG